MSKITFAKGFVAAVIASLPKGILMITNDTSDGAYLLTADFIIPYDSYGNGIHRANKAARTLPAGTIVISTENGHWYRLDDKTGGLGGLGKRGNALVGCLVQRVSLSEVVVADYVKPKKKVVKKKVAKKKVVKKKVAKKKTAKKTRRW